MEFRGIMKIRSFDFKLRSVKWHLVQKVKKAIHLIRSELKKLKLYLLLVTVLLLVQHYHNAPFPNIYLKSHWDDGKTLKEASINKLLKPWYKTSSNNIFFHETSLIEDGIIRLNARQACAIESAGKLLTFELKLVSWCWVLIWVSYSIIPLVGVFDLILNF